MKKRSRVLWMIVFCLVFVKGNSYGQSFEAQQLLLDWQKLTELKNILSDLYKGYQVLDQGYTAIKNISQGNFNLHQIFLDALLKVSPAVQKYKRVADIINNQLQLVKEYKAAWHHFQQESHFTVEEIGYLGRVYDNLGGESVKCLDDLLTVVTAGKLRMSDEERMRAVDKIYERGADQLDFLRHFNNSTALLALQRSKEQEEVDVSKRLR